MLEILLTAILALIINGLIIIGIHRATRDGQIFGFVERWWGLVPEKSAHDEEKRLEKVFDDFALWIGEIWPNGEDENTYYGMSYQDARRHGAYLWWNWLSFEVASKPPTIAYPLTECPVCMSSVWGALCFSGFYLPTIPVEYSWAVVPYVLALCGLMWIGRGLWMEAAE